MAAPSGHMPVVHRPDPLWCTSSPLSNGKFWHWTAWGAAGLTFICALSELPRCIKCRMTSPCALSKTEIARPYSPEGPGQLQKCSLLGLRADDSRGGAVAHTLAASSRVIWKRSISISAQGRAAVLLSRLNPASLRPAGPGHSRIKVCHFLLQV